MPSRTLAGSAALKGDWLLGEDNWKDDMDSNLLWLSVLTQGRFIDVVTTEPGSPTEGDVYVLAAAHPTHPNELAVYDEAAWHYRAPLAGWRLFNTTLSVFAQFSGTAWGMDSAALTAEDVRDIIGAALVSGTNVTVTPNDGADTITIAATGGSSGPTDEQIQDMIATFLLQGTNVTLTYDDTGNHLTITSAGGGGGSATQQSAKMWRIRTLYDNNNTANSWVAIGEVQFKDAGGTILTSGGTGISSGFFNGTFAPSTAFDGVLPAGDSGWLSQSGVCFTGYTSPEVWLGYENPTAIAPTQVSIYPHANYSAAFPKKFAIDFSLDGGISWYAVVRCASAAPVVGTPQTFAIPTFLIP